VYSKRFVVRLAISCLAALATISAFPVPAGADEAEPSIIGLAWYWQEQKNESVDTPNGTVSFELPNQFCPTLPSSLGSPDPATCAEGRIPVEVVSGDYETPDKLSAIAFDLSMIPLGSTISKFEITLLEAESGCSDSQDSQTGQKCEQTDARNADGKEVRACAVSQIFGDGENRPYNEVPKFECTDSDPVATRSKEFPNDAEADPADADPDHDWTWDLTSYAQEWAKTPPQCTCVLFHPLQPKEDPQDADNLDWRVVFSGPKVTNGIKATVVFKPAKGGGPGIPPPDTTPTDPIVDTGSSGSTGGFGTTTTGTFGGDDNTGTGDSSAPSSSGDAQAPVDVAAEPAVAKIPQPFTPAYVWISILAGFVVWSLVRSLVFDRAMGHRPDGVLAQIQQINSSRSGGAASDAVVASAGPGTALKGGLGRIGAGLRSLTSKLPGRKG
jgi:hypothetical protein